MAIQLPEPLKINVGDKITKISFIHKNEVFESAPDGTVFVFDENTQPLFPKPPGVSLVLPPGESEKHLDSVKSILAAGIDAGLARDGLFYGIGGGVIGDMTAFAASIYMRGCAVKLVPTTLLSMVDASLGGKTGVDFNGYKNMAGAFFPADEILICPEVLLSLPEAEYLSGLAEVLKHAFLSPSDWLERFKNERNAILSRDMSILPELIRDSLMVKASVVEVDFREQGIRAHLNLGHTFGHALEKLSNFTGWSHGEAVAWGIGCAMRAGVLMGLTDENYAQDVMKLLDDYGYRLKAPGFSPEAFIDAMGKDKKKKGGIVRFVLQRNWGDTFLSEIPRDILLKTLEESGS